MNGIADSLWPTELTVDHIGGSRCQTSDHLYRTSTHPGCMWAGYTLLKDLLRQPTVQHIAQLTVGDQLGTRLLSGQKRSPDQVSWNQTLGEQYETFTLAPHMTEVSIAPHFENIWFEAAIRSKTLRSMFLRFAFPYTGYARTNVTAVRARCTIQEVSAGQIDDKIQWRFPALPENSPHRKEWWTLNETLGAGEMNGTYAMSRWVSLADAEKPRINPHQTLPSAAILISLASYSRARNLTSLFVLPCSVDARWAEGVNMRTKPGPSPPLQHIGRPFQMTLTPGPEDLTTWAPPTDGSWRKLSIGHSFLEWLTPSLDGGPSSRTTMKRTTLSDLIENSWSTANGSDYKNYAKSDWPAVAVEKVITHLFAEALSRVGLSDNLHLWNDLGGQRLRTSSRAQRAMLANANFTKTPDFPNKVKSSWEVRNTGKAGRVIPVNSMTLS